MKFPHLRFLKEKQNMKHRAVDLKTRLGKTMCLKDELDSFMNHIGLDTRLHEMKILDVWKQCVGESIAEFSTPVELRKSKLFVSVENAAWRYELSLRKEEIMEKLNSHFNKKLIREIIFV